MMISFIFIEYFSVEDIKKSLRIIDSNSYSFKYEIIISSNSLYNKETKKELKSKFNSVIWVFNKKNGGFAYAMNRGIKICSGDFVIIQNPDTKIVKNKLDDAINFLKNNRQVAILGPKIVNKNNKVQDSYRDFFSLNQLIERQFKKIFIQADKLYEAEQLILKPRFVDWVIGAFMIIPAETFKKIGFFSEDYFMYVEDMDLCYRASINNLKVVYFPDLVIQYEGDRKSSIFKNTPNKYTLIHLKSLATFFIKNFSKSVD